MCGARVPATAPDTTRTVPERGAYNFCKTTIETHDQSNAWPRGRARSERLNPAPPCRAESALCPMGHQQSSLCTPPCLSHGRLCMARRCRPLPRSLQRRRNLGKAPREYCGMSHTPAYGANAAARPLARPPGTAFACSAHGDRERGGGKAEPATRERECSKQRAERTSPPFVAPFVGRRRPRGCSWTEEDRRRPRRRRPQSAYQW